MMWKFLLPRSERLALPSLVLVLLTGMLLGSGCGQSSTAGNQGAAKGSPTSADNLPPILVRTVQPQRDHVQRTTTQPAHVQPYEKADIYAKASGYLRAIPVDLGDRVTKDQVLAELSIPELDTEYQQRRALLAHAEAEKRQAEAAFEVAQTRIDAAQAKVAEVHTSVARYEAEVALWNSEYQRTDTLVSRAAATQSLLDETRNKLRAAEANRAMVEAQIKSAEAALKESRAELAKAQSDIATASARVEVASAELNHFQTLMQYATITAPFDGLITRRLVDPGAFIQSAADSGQASPLVTLMRLDRKRIVVDIPESEAGWVQIGQPATFRYNSLGKRTMTGDVVRIADALEPGTRTMRIEIVVEDPEEIRPGIYGQATIILADYPDALVLPSTALLHGESGAAVMVVEAGRAKRRAIEVGLDNGEQAQILEGLSGTEAVIMEGNTTVRDGQRVEVAG